LTNSLPRVAVLLSTYNGAEFLGAQLDSLAAQTGVICDLFVRDDGSTDETLAVLARYASQWPRLAAPLMGPNLGPAMSFLELLRGVPDGFDAYAFCDQDDVWLPDKLSRATARLSESDPRTPMLYCSSVTLVDQSLNPLGLAFANSDTRFEQLLFNNTVGGMTVVLNRALFDLIQSAKPSGDIVMHDWWCALVAAGCGAIVYDPAPTALYRQHGANVIGAQSSPLAVLLGHLRRFLKNPRGFYRIHGQSLELECLYGRRLSSEASRTLRQLVASKRSLATRIAYALWGPVVRPGFAETIFARILIATGLY